MENQKDMERINVNVEMTFTLDKSIYTAPNFEWPLANEYENMQKIKNYETFFDKHFVEHITDDYAIIKREAAYNMQYYSGIVKFLDHIKDDIRNSIQFQVLSDNNNIETVKANFNFGYYKSGYDPEDLFNTLVIGAGVNRYKGNIKTTNKAVYEQQPYNKNINMEIINNEIKRWEFAVSFFDSIKYTLSSDLDKKEEITQVNTPFKDFSNFFKS